MKEHRIWSRATTSLLGQGLNLALGIGASIPIARGLGTAGKGQFAFYSWGFNLTVLLLGWGWHIAVATLVSEDPRVGPAVVQASRRSLLPAALLLCLIAACCMLMGVSGWGWAAAAAAVQIWGLPASGALIGAGRLSAYYGGLLTQSGIALAGFLTFWLLLESLTPESGVAILAVGVAGAMCVHTLQAGSGFRIGSAEKRRQPRLSELARHAWFASLAAFLIYRLDFLFVRFFAGVHGLGLYSTATGIAEIGRMAPNAVGQAAVRALGAAPEENRKAVALHVLRLGLPGSFLVLMTLVAGSFWIVPALYGDAFAPAAPLVGWLAPGVAFLAVASVSASWLNVSRRSATIAKISWLGCAISTSLYLLLVPILGITGAAVASTLSYTATAAFSWRAACRPRVVVAEKRCCRSAESVAD